MYSVLLTQNNGILGPVAKALGFIMNAIFNGLYSLGIPSIGLAIILFTLVIYLLLTPLTIKQQKFSKLSAKMNPEIQAIQAKYKGKKDNESMMKMNEETKAVYAKYGTSPTGSCVQLLIQMPILIALYRVIDNVPAYVTKVKDAFFPFVDSFIQSKGSFEFISNSDNFTNATRFKKMFEEADFVNKVVDSETVRNTFIDVLNKASTLEWNNISENFNGLKASCENTLTLIERYNSFLGINIANSPSYMFKQGISSKQFGLIIAAILIPLLSALTQWINTKLMPQPNTSGNAQQDSMAASMKSMNIMMPIMSAFFCFSLPSGMGLYWIAGAVIRCFQQVLINKHLDKVDFDELVKKNAEKNKVKNEKKKNAINVASLSSNSKISTKAIVNSSKEDEEKIEKAYENSKNAKKDSITAKANLVKEFNNK